MPENSITEVTRRDIVAHLRASEISWAGRLSQPEFLARLFDLDKLPSNDDRFSTARGDISIHTVSFHDWEPDWIFTDNRFAILWVSDNEFLRFLCEMLHPIVRPDPKDSRGLAAALNRVLSADGWELFEESELSGRPVFGAHRTGQRAVIFTEPTGWEKVDRQIQEVRLRLHEASAEEQFQAVGLLCREVMISLAQAVHDPARHMPVDGVPPSPTDAARMLEAYFVAELGGEGNEEARTHAKAALKLASALQHRRTADYRHAALSAEAAASIVNLVAIISGRRPSPGA
jgi:hypothetical protein